MSPVTTFEVPVSISDPPLTTCKAPVGPAPPEKRPRTWEDMAAAAGVIIMTSADNEEPNWMLDVDVGDVAHRLCMFS